MLCILQSEKGYTGSSLENSYTGVLVDYFKAEAALSKFGSSEELIDLAAKDLICLPLGEVSHDRALAFYPLRVAANLRQRGRVLIRLRSLLRHPSLTLTSLDAPTEWAAVANTGNEP